MTEEEKQEIIDKAVEKALLLLPETVGNLMAQQATYAKINSQFYKDHPEFADYKQVVASVVEYIDGTYPDLEYEDKLKKAVPIIKERIRTMSTLNMDKAERPSRDFKKLELDGNGAI